jgi:thioredoxin-like negative regulator of GroEL
MCLLPLTFALVCALPANAGDPFVALDFEAASSKARAEDKLLVVDFTAPWCPSCKEMDKQTWPDEAVVKWIGEHAVAIQVNVDKQPELVKRFGFEAIPTMIFLKDVTELDRYTGFKSPEEFLGWANDVLAGKYSKITLAAKGTALLESDDVHARLDMARECWPRDSTSSRCSTSSGCGRTREAAPRPRAPG